MIKIRKGLFETNSSSMHSVVISNDILKGNDYKKTTYKICFNRDYNRGELEILADPISKAEFYLACYAVLECDTDKLPILLDKDKGEKALKDAFEQKSKLIEGLLKEEGWKAKIHLPEYKWNDPWSYRGDNYPGYWQFIIANEGFYEFRNLMTDLENIELLKNFLFNCNSFVILGGDEYTSCIEGSALIAQLLKGKKYIGYNMSDEDIDLGFSAIFKEWECYE